MPGSPAFRLAVAARVVTMTDVATLGVCVGNDLHKEVQDARVVGKMRPTRRRTVDLDVWSVCSGRLQEVVVRLGEQIAPKIKVAVEVEGLRCMDCGEEFFHDDALRAPRKRGRCRCQTIGNRTAIFGG